MNPLKIKDFGLAYILLIVFLLILPQQVHASQPQQEEKDKVTLNVMSERISDILGMIERQTNYIFAWNGDAQKKITARRSISVNEAPVLQVLSSILKDSGLSFSIKGKQIFISDIPKEDETKKLAGTNPTSFFMRAKGLEPPRFPART